MCTGFTTDDICMNTMRAVSLVNNLRAVADAFRPLKTFFFLFGHLSLPSGENAVGIRLLKTHQRY